MGIATVVFLTAGVMLLIFGIVLLLVVRSMRSQFDGYLDVSERNARKIYKLDIQTDPEELRKQKYMVLKIRQIPDL